jgi:hypothetical protein
MWCALAQPWPIAPRFPSTMPPPLGPGGAQILVPVDPPELALRRLVCRLAVVPWFEIWVVESAESWWMREIQFSHGIEL